MYTGQKTLGNFTQMLSVFRQTASQQSDQALKGEAKEVYLNSLDLREGDYESGEEGKGMRNS